MKMRAGFAFAAWLIAILAVIVNAFLSKDSGTKFGNGSNFIMISDVTVTGMGEVSTPVSVSMPEKEEITVSFTVPEGIREGDGFMYFSNYCVSLAKIDGEVIGGYGQEMPLPWGRMLGNIRVIVPLSPEHIHKTVTLHMTSMYHQTYALGAIPIASEMALRYEILKQNIWRIVFLSFFACTLLIALAIGVHHYVYHRRDRGRMYLCLAGFIVSIVIWMLCSSDLPQFMLDKNAVVSFVSFLALAFMGPAFMGFCFQALPKGGNAFLITARVGLLLPIANIVLYMTNVIDPVYLMYLTHFYIIGCLLLLIVNCFRGFKTSKEARLLMVGIFLFVISIVAALVLFYFNTMDARVPIILSTGLAAFIFFTICMMLAKEDRMIGERTASNMFKELAFKDYLTGCGNRAAFEEELAHCADNKASRVTMVMFDLNYLKTTNDELGHQAGDEIIRGIASCIQEAFAPEGRCFRLGGDEFATVLWDRKCEMDEYLEDLNQALERYNEEHVIPLSVAVGYAEGDNPGHRDGLNGIYTKADKGMYRNKMECHTKMGGEDTWN